MGERTSTLFGPEGIAKLLTSSADPASGTETIQTFDVATGVTTSEVDVSLPATGGYDQGPLLASGAIEESAPSEFNAASSLFYVGSMFVPGVTPVRAAGAVGKYALPIARSIGVFKKAAPAVAAGTAATGAALVATQGANPTLPTPSSFDTAFDTGTQAPPGATEPRGADIAAEDMHLAFTTPEDSFTTQPGGAALTGPPLTPIGPDRTTLNAAEPQSQPGGFEQAATRHHSQLPHRSA